MEMARAAKRSFFLHNGIVGLSLSSAGRRLRERIYARKGDDWVLVATSGRAKEGVASLVFKVREADGLGRVPVSCKSLSRRSPSEVIIAAEAAGRPVTIRASVDEGDDFIRYQVCLAVAESIDVELFLSRYLFVPEGLKRKGPRPLDFTYAPNVRPQADEVIGDHKFHAPVASLQKGSISLSLVPDVGMLNRFRTRQFKTALNLDCRSGDEPLVEYGFCDWETRGHVYYFHPTGKCVRVSNRNLEYGFCLFASARTPARGAFRRPVRLLWREFLSPALAAEPSLQLRSFDEWEHHCWYEYGEAEWFDIRIGREACGSLACRRETVGRALWVPRAKVRDAWFNHWFQTLRTALAMHKSGKRLRDRVLRSRAVKVLKLALNAPQQRGAFPTVLYVDQRTGTVRWERDNAWAGIRHCYHAFDMAWTAFWMLQWHRELRGREPRIMAFCTAFADFLLRNQLESGCIPAYYDAQALAPLRHILYDDNAETAGCAVFLARLYEETRRERYLEGALKCMRYVTRRVLPRQKWFDYETFLSCSPKALDFYDEYTNQYPQNNLSIMQAAKAYLYLYRLTGDSAHLRRGEYVLDYLSLFQQVWSPLHLTPNLLGGFGTQNSDGEWSDARQAYAADLYLEFYEATEKQEYFERAVAALRASFPVAPYENYAHVGEDRHGALSGFHWGTGSGFASVVFCRERYGDAFVNLVGGWGVGIDGCSVRNVVVNHDAASFDVVAAFDWTRPMRITFRAERAYRLKINGKSVGRFSAEQLQRGIDLRLRL